MHLRCIFGFHLPSAVSITRRGERLEALCEDCGLLLNKEGPGRWQPAPPLVRRG